MKIIFIFNLLALLLVPLSTTAAAAENRPLMRLAALVEYIGADYAGAVQNGQVVQASEYAEQRDLLREANLLPARLEPLEGHAEASARLQQGLDILLSDVSAHRSEAQVVKDCRVIRQLLIDDYGLVLWPSAPPSEERAKAVYRARCATCHGESGHADTPTAQTLHPRPLSFFDEERMSRLSPQLAFSSITFGVKNTAMAPFDSLPASDRWSLAFWLVGLRHDKTAAKRGGEIFKQAHLELAPTPSRLSALSDQEMAVALQPIAPDDRSAVIAYLRTRVPFAPPPGGPFANARRLLAELVDSDPHNREHTRDLAIAAYLEGIEPHEAGLRARDPALCTRIENSFLTLRQLLEAGTTVDGLRTQVGRIELLLDRADEALAPQTGHVPFVAALTIALREGFEWSLLITALLAFVRKSGRGEMAPWVHYGWMAALPAGAITWFLIGAAIGGAQRELSEGLLTLVAAAMLLFVSNLVLGKAESRHWLRFLERKTREGGGAKWPLFSLAFVAAYREAVEIVLFFRALALDAPGHGWAIFGGIVVGLALLSLVIVLMTQLGRRMKPQPVMVASSVVLSLLAVSLVGQGVRALQEGGFVPLHVVSLDWPSLPLLGFFPSLEGLSAQLATLLFAVAPTLLSSRKTKTSS